MPGEGKCRDCGQDVIWVKTEKGKNIMLDPDRVKGNDPNAKFMIDDDEPDVAVYVPPKERIGLLYATHFDTCEAPEQVARREENKRTWEASRNK